MQERGSQATMSIRLIIQVFVALFVIAFGGLLLQWGAVFVSTQQDINIKHKNDVHVVVVENVSLDGVVLSMKDDRFLHTNKVLSELGIKVTQKTPPSFMSTEVDQGLERYVGSRVYHSAPYLKVWSNRMAFIDALEEFVQDSSGTAKTWRFFFEDDIAMHPKVTAEKAKVLVQKGLKLADDDGFMYLGICGPNCTDTRSLLDDDNGDGDGAGDGGDGKGVVQAARCAGTCAHAFGFQRWKAGEFLTEMSGLTLKGVEGPVLLGVYFDRYMYEYGNQVNKVWVVGSNLKSPVTSVLNHFGLLFQDRTLYPSTIGE